MLEQPHSGAINYLSEVQADQNIVTRRGVAVVAGRVWTALSETPRSAGKVMTDRNLKTVYELDSEMAARAETPAGPPAIVTTVIDNRSRR